MENIETPILNESDLEQKAKLERKTKTGFTIILWGGLILLISGFVALFTPLSQTGFDVVLYGLTSISSAMIIYGLYLAIG
jgi:hypothetical protein